MHKNLPLNPADPSFPYHTAWDLVKATAQRTWLRANCDAEAQFAS